MTWLERIGFKLFMNWGLPMLKKLIPWVPEPVWEAIVAFLNHLGGLGDPSAAAAVFTASTYSCIGATGCPPQTK